MKTLHSLPVIAQLMLLVGSMLLLWTAAALLTLFLSYAGLDITTPRVMLLSQGISQLLVFLVPSLLFVVCFHRNERFLCYDCGRKQWRNVGLGLLALLLLTPAVDMLGQWNNSWHFGGPWESIETSLRNITAHAEALTREMLAMPHWSDLVLVLVVVALIPAVCEEMLFRGVIQHAIARHWGNAHVAVWITALLFSLCHGEFFALLPRLLLGALLGYLYAYSRSLLANSFVHFVNNSVVVVHYYLFQHGILDFSPDEPLNLPLITTLCCTAAAGYIIWETWQAGEQERKLKLKAKN